jgi:predicted transcriptional regulator
MSSDLQIVEERERKRYSLLKTIYDASGDDTSDGIRYSEAFAKAGLEEDEGHDILEYLMQRGLMSNRTGIGWLALSHQGIVEMEQSIMHPEQPTEHFRSDVVQRFYAAVGVVQNAVQSISRRTQNDEATMPSLNADQKLVTERRERRERTMRRIYDKSEGNISRHIYYHEVRAEEALTETEFNPVFDYLKANGLVDDRYSGGVFQITQLGVECVESQIKKPYVREEASSERTEQHFYGPVGAVQNAAGSTAYVTQTNTTNSAELLSLIQQLRARLEGLPLNEEALEQLNDLEEEVKSATPRKSRIVATAKYIGSIVKDIGVSVAAEAIVKTVGG